MHGELIADPRSPVPAERLARLADPDARDNYAAVLRFRDRLLARPTLEAAYLDCVRTGAAGMPPLFLDQLVHVILRHLLAGCDDPIRLRAAELLFREQKVMIQDGAIMLADEETVEMRARRRPRARTGSCSRARLRRDSIELDVLDEANAAIYWARSDRFDTVLDLSFARARASMRCAACSRPGSGTSPAPRSAIQPVQRIDDQRWVWHVGLDAEASAFLNDLYEGAGDRRGAPRPPAGAVPARVPRPGRHARAGARPPGLPRPGDDRRRSASS